VRFEQFLSDDLKEAIQSPENLQQISVRAESLLKASCRQKGQKLTFDDCFALAVSESQVKQIPFDK
jgi:hypothetical protein